MSTLLDVRREHCRRWITDAPIKLQLTSRKKRRSLAWGMRSRFSPSARTHLPPAKLWLGKPAGAPITRSPLDRS
jgi:hypothetical protein